MTRFLLIRHATTDAVGKRLSGRKKGVHLNEKGQGEAQHLAGRLASLPLNAIYSSKLERALQTAAPIAATHGLDVTANDHFLELDFGDWTDCSFEDMEQQPAFKRFNAFRSCTRIPGGETMLEAQARMVNGIEQLCNQHRDETIAIVSHSDLIKATLAYYAGIHLDMFQRIEISPASVSIIELYDETARIMLMNHTGAIKMPK